MTGQEPTSVEAARRLLCLGECMVELSPQAQTDDGQVFRMSFAGDSFNTAWYARKLLPASWQVAYGSCIGDDELSDEMAEFMTAAGIDTRALRRIQESTVGLYMILLREGERSFSYWRGQSAARRLADDPDWLMARIAEAGTLFFSGITLAILPPSGRSVLLDALAAARKQGKRVVFDTNMRPRLWEDRETMCRTLERGAEVAQVVLPSFDEEQAAFGDKSPSATAKRYQGLGAETVVVKNGAGPVHLCHDDHLGFYDPPVVAQVVDTTAAGDSFAAGFMAGVLQGEEPAKAVEAAMRLSALVVRHRGALVDPTTHN